MVFSPAAAKRFNSIALTGFGNGPPFRLAEPAFAMSKTPIRKIIHVDMDAFYASVLDEVGGLKLTETTSRY
ncbi:MAG: hypothetical protein KGJ49_13865 [Alphaproteobacteria bacterium]|nr:hypothetical protein [Alphaproteobacteria bacterium]